MLGGGCCIGILLLEMVMDLVFSAENETSQRLDHWFIYFYIAVYKSGRWYRIFNIYEEGYIIGKKTDVRYHILGNIIYLFIYLFIYNT